MSTTQTTQSARPTGAQRTSQGSFSKEDLEQARLEIVRAFEICGLIENGRPKCPNCGTSESGKIKLRQSGAYTCYKCKGSPDNYAVTLVCDRLGLDPKRRDDLRHAVELLLGRAVTTREGRPVEPVSVLRAEPEFKAVVDSDVYHYIRDNGSVGWAQKFYARFHIDADAVSEAGCVVIDDVDAVHSGLTATFGRDRLVACGIVKAGVDGAADRFLFNKSYPVVEPHRLPDGTWVGLQFRGSRRTEQKVRDYPAQKAAYEARKASWEAEREGQVFDPNRKMKPRHTPKFLSLQGGVVGEHLVGMGLPAVAGGRPGALVYIVEGMKDLLAARTLGVLAYAIPGTNHLPPPVAMSVLSDRTPLVCTDGDEAGEKGAVKLLEYFESADIRARRQVLPTGLDVTDVLVRKHARRGCDCEVCARWVASHPEDAPKR